MSFVQNRLDDTDHSIIRSGTFVRRERNVLLILDERSTGMYGKMVPSATQANQRMCGLAVELRSDSGTKSKV